MSKSQHDNNLNQKNKDDQINYRAAYMEYSKNSPVVNHDIIKPDNFIDYKEKIQTQDSIQNQTFDLKKDKKNDKDDKLNVQDEQIVFAVRAKSKILPFLDIFLEAQAEGLTDKQGRSILFQDGQADVNAGIMLTVAGFLSDLSNTEQKDTDQLNTDGIRADIIYFRDGTPEYFEECIGVRFWKNNSDMHAIGMYSTWSWAKNSVGVYEDELVGPDIALYGLSDIDNFNSDIGAMIYSAADMEATRRNLANNNNLEFALTAAQEEISATVLRISHIYNIDVNELLSKLKINW